LRAACSCDSAGAALLQLPLLQQLPLLRLCCVSAVWLLDAELQQRKLLLQLPLLRLCCWWLLDANGGAAPLLMQGTYLPYFYLTLLTAIRTFFVTILLVFTLLDLTLLTATSTSRGNAARRHQRGDVPLRQRTSADVSADVC
jgi:hypothetical protein